MRRTWRTSSSFLIYLFVHSVYAVGITEEDMNKPQIGIVPIWWEGNPCNSHLLDLARNVKEGCTSEGLVGLTFNTIGRDVILFVLPI